MDKEMLEKTANEIAAGIAALREKNEILEKAHVAVETKQAEIKETIDKIMKKCDELEVEMKKHAAHSSGVKIVSPEHKAFLHWLRTGDASIPELKVLKLSDATLGGYLTSPEITQELLKTITEYSPIRSIARVRTTSKESVQVRKRTGTFSAAWVAETGTKSETTGLTYGLETIPTHELYAMVDVSNWDLEDSDFNLEAELNSEFGEQFGKAEGAAFISGNAVGKPEGILTNSEVGYVASGDASSLKADGFFSLYFGLKSGYTKNAKFVMNRATMLAASILKDDVKNYLLRRLGESPTWNILGVDVVEAADMPNVSANAFPVLFGDFKAGYLIVDRIAIAVLRDPYSAATSNCVRFHARKRVGGQVVLPEAIKKLKIAAS